MEIIKPPRLSPGDTIGTVAPCYSTERDKVEARFNTLKGLGFKVKASKNLYSVAYDYAGTVQERVDDIHQMACDPQVKMVLFGGGEVANELLPYLDFDLLARHPKIYCSYSDSTTLLDAIHSKTGLVTFYGASLRTFEALNEYNHRSFADRLMSDSLTHEQCAPWRAITGGNTQGALIGGYLANLALLQNGGYFSLDKAKRYILLVEDHIIFSSPPAVARYFAHLEQSGLFSQVTGLIFGHYSPEPQPVIDQILTRLGQRYRIPVVRCDDFGHGANNAIFPLGINASLDADALTFSFAESGVQ